MPQSITTISFFRFSSLQSKLWAFGQMQFAHPHLHKIPGLRFYKLMGSGKGHGFNPFPDWGVYTLLAVWESEAEADHFFSEAAVFQRYRTQSSEQWTLYMHPIKAKGLWSGGNPFEPTDHLDTSNPFIAVITRATIRKRHLFKFWGYVPVSERPISESPGLLYTKGIGEVPLVHMATFSLWENEASLHAFAYKSQEHLGAIQKTKQFQWYKEEMFARFQPYRSIGTWGGRNPLEGRLSSANG
ncbi:MAG TPA: DUF3291 domain-containing protein [Saprospirales bacterium]|nr:DUF3291 domain-containing protein [Saprospirales bacterium]